jgi:hypothetical protein
MRKAFIEPSEFQQVRRCEMGRYGIGVAGRRGSRAGNVLNP